MSLARAEALVTRPDAVARRSFLPLISYAKRERRWKGEGKGWKLKSRPIAYASHADSHIFAYYSWMLGNALDDKIEEAGLGSIVLAYRKHVIDPRRSNRGKANFHFAAEAFAEIVSGAPCDVIALDIEKFFDRIPHKRLKSNWRWLLDSNELAADHYAVFKAATQFACVSAVQLRKALGLGRRAFRQRRSFGLSGKEFDSQIRVAGLIQTNRKAYGIPQGLPISGLLANLVMFELDASMAEAARGIGGSYRRYSDDILLTAPEGQCATLEAALKRALADLGLQVQDAKTQYVSFKIAPDGRIAASKELQYLGLQFDGQRVLVRPQTLSKFGKRMVRAVRRARNAARKSTPACQPIRLRRRDLYARFSHLLPHRETSQKKRPRGSFMKYAKSAGRVVDDTATSAEFLSQIRKQLRGQWPRLQQLIAEAERSEDR